MTIFQFYRNPLWPVLRFRSGLDRVYSAFSSGRVFTRENRTLALVSPSSEPFIKYTV